MEMSEEPLLVEESNEFISRAELDANRMSDKGELCTMSKMSLTHSLPRLINFNFLFQSLARDISYSMENLARDSLLG